MRPKDLEEAKRFGSVSSSFSAGVDVRTRLPIMTLLCHVSFSFGDKGTNYDWNKVGRQNCFGRRSFRVFVTMLASHPKKRKSVRRLYLSAFVQSSPSLNSVSHSTGTSVRAKLAVPVECDIRYSVARQCYLSLTVA